MLTTHIKNVVKSVPGALWLVYYARSWIRKPSLRNVGPEGVELMGHRKYVGGRWEIIGRLQFDFLISEGLRPHHYLLDIACGSLRAGVHLIPYLESGHYLGIEKEESLLLAGIKNELDSTMLAQKRPELVISNSFEFHKFSARPHYALAQSLFTHLPAGQIRDCFKKLRRFIRDDGVFYATFNEVPVEVFNRKQPHDHATFQYTRRQMEQFGADHEWRSEYIGDWNHPSLEMMRYRPA